VPAYREVLLLADAAVKVALECKVALLVDWMRQKGEEAHAKGAVFGVSGGIDSALVLALAKKAWPDTCMGLILPCHSLPADAADALELLEMFNCPHRVQDLTAAYDAFLLGRPEEESPSLRLARANLKPRLRMMALYYEANLSNYLVVGTGNRDEIYVGYSTKYGDGGVDIQPLGGMTKGEVRVLASYLGVPDRIVGKPPSAGLWEGQTDEEEMGLTYRDIDAYLQGKDVPEEVRTKIERRHAATDHKRRTPPIPDLK
jgi:NAD+ synthase